ncbi:MAG: ABC transporter permease [Tepidibacter sp.]|jgi:ABC-type antimicrobial peptide transport system permease subunit|uniref:ABC transporter permease n=1 Tax=Tepidibacter sp. TaxID=2529387 RepID=UPI0025EA5DD2|nr:ABC transporter permease [Tepidibacter sp.]MCT4507720.1 ABC transporter permease [Tepidibacter sp.]
MKKKLNLGNRYVKEYKGRSFAIIISIILSIVLIVGIGTLKQTNDNVELLKMKYETGIYQVEFKGINKDQVKKIQENNNIKNLGLFYLYKSTAEEEKQHLDIMAANNDYITSGAKLIRGRLPKEKDEMVAEEWVLRSLGIQPQINKEIILKVDDGQGGSKKEKFKLVGIISDRAESEAKGLRQLFIPFDLKSEQAMFANLVFKKGTDIYGEIDKIIKYIAIPKKNVYIMNDIISLETSNNKVTIHDIQTLIYVSLICGIVIYGIFNISIYKRVHEYGILRAIGYNNLKIFKLVLQELFSLYIIAMPIGLILGIIGAVLFNNMAETIDTQIILNGQQINLGIVFPTEIILGSIISIGIIMILISFLTYRQIKKISIVDSIKENLNSNNIKRNFVTIRFLQKYIKTYKAISFKNIFRNKKSFLMIVLSMSICGILFITLNYKLSISDSKDFEMIRTIHMNSDFTIDRYDGTSEAVIKEIRKLDGIKSLETCMLMNSKLIINENDILNQKYFDKLNSESNHEYFDYFFGKDKKTNELILRNNFRGYNDYALKKLNDYVLDGDIDINKMKNQDLAVVYIPQVNEKNYRPLRKGDSILDIRPGDNVTVKFRKDKVKYLDDNYDKLTDENVEYMYKDFTVGAVVSYDYMYEGFMIGFDSVDIIVSEEKFKEITGINDYFSVNVNMNEGTNHKELETNILKITSKIKGVIFRDLVEQRENIKALHNKTKIYNLGITFILFIITISNIINNIGYNIISRTNEFGILRAVGINNVDFKKMIVFEGLLYGVISSIIVIVTSFIIQKIIYEKSGVISIGVNFSINYINYIIVIFINLLLGVIATYFQSKKIENRSIVECINKIN